MPVCAYHDYTPILPFPTAFNKLFEPLIALLSNNLCFRWCCSKLGQCKHAEMLKCSLGWATMFNKLIVLNDIILLRSIFLQGMTFLLLSIKEEFPGEKSINQSLFCGNVTVVADTISQSLQNWMLIEKHLVYTDYQLNWKKFTWYFIKCSSRDSLLNCYCLLQKVNTLWYLYYAEWLENKFTLECIICTRPMIIHKKH